MVKTRKCGFFFACDDHRYQKNPNPIRFVRLALHSWIIFKILAWNPDIGRYKGLGPLIGDE
jgi:hypothetical protein